MKRFIFVILAFCCCSFFAEGQIIDRLKSPVGKFFFREQSDGSFSWKFENEEGKVENTRLVAIALDVTLGFFGMHRLYLGTDVKVPVIYTLTLGGGMILWVIDLGLLIFTEDISKYYNNPNVFMWLPKE